MAAADGALREPCLDLLRHETARRRSPAVSVAEVAAHDPEAVLFFLRRHRLDQLWLRAVTDAGLADALPATLAEPLRQARRSTAVAVMMQAEAARHAGRALAKAGVDYLLFKGIQLGEQLYGDAVLRPTADVDVLVAEADRERAVAALAGAGFARLTTGGPSYEETLSGHGAGLDLHWHLLQPERCREPLTGWLLASREERGGLAFPDAEATLVVLLLNPAVTDHVTERLIQPLDVDRWLRQRPVVWPRVLDRLARTGLATAAWAMLWWTHRLFATPVPDAVWRALAPRPLRRAYLRAWIERDPAAVYQRLPLLVRGGFSLFLHDRAGDAVRALRGLR